MSLNRALIAGLAVAAPDRSGPAAAQMSATTPVEPESAALEDVEEACTEAATPPEWEYNETVNSLAEWWTQFDPLTLEELFTADDLTINCRNNWPPFGWFLNETERDLGGFYAIGEMSESELQEFADSGDNGFAQASLAQRLLEQLTGDPETDAALMENVLHYSAKAIVNRNFSAADLLFRHYYEHDRIEARAWMQVSHAAGSPLLLRREDQEGMGVELNVFTDAEVWEGEKRAAELIAEYELEPGLGPPEECLGRFKRE